MSQRPDAAGSGVGQTQEAGAIIASINNDIKHADSKLDEFLSAPKLDSREGSVTPDTSDEVTNVSSRISVSTDNENLNIFTIGQGTLSSVY